MVIIKSGSFVGSTYLEVGQTPDTPTKKLIRIKIEYYFAFYFAFFAFYGAVDQQQTWAKVNTLKGQMPKHKQQQH